MNVIASVMLLSRNTIFYLLTIVGLVLIWQALTNTIARDTFGDPRYANRIWYFIAGVLLQIPLIAYVVFLER